MVVKVPTHAKASQLANLHPQNHEFAGRYSATSRADKAYPPLWFPD